MLHRRSCYACFTIAVLAVANSAVAVTTQWNSNLGGSFTNAALWSAGVPTSTDTAVFNRNLNIEYGVSFPGRPILTPLVREVKELKVGTNTVSFSDSVDFNQLPASFKIDAANSLGEDALIIGDSAGQVAELNTTLADFSTGSATIANAAGSTGTLNVSGGTFNVTGLQQFDIEFYIGRSGNGTLNISNGADVIGSGETRLAGVAGSVGAVTVIGAGSTLTAGELAIGNAGSATLNVSAGGAVNFSTLSVNNSNSSATVSGSGSTVSGGGLEVDRGTLTIQSGGQATSSAGYITGTATNTGVVDIGGAGSAWTVSNFLFVGYGGSGTLNIHDGGQVSSPLAASIGYLLVNPIRPGTGVVHVDGTTSSFSAESLNVGVDGTGTLSITGGATVTIENSLAIGQMGTVTGTGAVMGSVSNGGIVAPGTSPGALQVTGDFTQSVGGDLEIQLGGTTPGVTYDQLLVTGALTAGGTLSVTTVDLGGGMFSPQAGDSFNILDFGSLSGAFVTVSLPALSGNLAWNTSQLYSHGVIGIVFLGVPGDYNNNGTVDAADYVLWRNGGPLANEVDAPGIVNAADYSTWRARFGNSAGSGASPASGASAAAVPEPAGSALVVVTLFCLAAARRRVGNVARGIVFAFAFSVAARSSHAVTTNWNTNSTGSYTNAANWSAGVPTSADTGVFNRNLNIEYGVTFPGRPIVSPLVREVKQVKVGTNSVSFSDSTNINQLPASFKIDAANTLLEDALIIGDTAGQVATLTSTLADFSASTVTIGNAAGSTGTLNLNGGTLNVTQTDHGVSTTEFYVGKQGTGTLNVTNGAHLIVAGESRLNNSSAVTVSGAGSRWQSSTIFLLNVATTISVLAGGSLVSDLMDGYGNTSISGVGSSMVVGRFYSRLATLSNGATAAVDELLVGDTIVEGVGSTWTVNQSLQILTPGLKIRNGGQVFSTNPTLLGRPQTGDEFPYPAADGILEIDGIGSQIVTPVVVVGDGGVSGSSLILKNGGSVSGSVFNNFGTLSGTGTITGSVTGSGIVKPKLLHVNNDYSQPDGGRLQFEFGGTTPSEYGQLIVDDTLSLQGTLAILLVDDFVPQPGDTFDILDFGNLLLNTLDLDLAPLPAPLKWDTSRLFIDGVLRAILPGDYNDNGTVDAADYVVWREKIVNNAGYALPNDGTFGVGFDDYITWRANFGNTAPSGSAAAAPEPSSALLIGILAAPVAFRRMRFATRR